MGKNLLRKVKNYLVDIDLCFAQIQSGKGFQCQLSGVFFLGKIFYQYLENNIYLKN